jgi:probable O-glycosylation ligase (exosortase A-associated)
MIAGNNELAVALVLLMPWMYYLERTTPRLWIRWSLLASMVAVTFAILGTQSRGALLGLLAMVCVLSLKAGRFLRTTAGAVFVVWAAVTFMPSSWTERMDTLQTYEEDSSAMERIYTWGTLWNAALDRPLVGTGFGADNPLVFALYAPRGSEELLQGRVFVAHSIYLQALGEHGFPGLLLYLGIGLWIWFAAGGLAAKTASDPEFKSWVPLLMRMSQVSLVGFAVGGAFLSLMLLDVPYYILAVVVLARATVHERISARAAAPVGVIASTASPEAASHAVVGRSSM